MAITLPVAQGALRAPLRGIADARPRSAPAARAPRFHRRTNALGTGQGGLPAAVQQLGCDTTALARRSLRRATGAQAAAVSAAAAFDGAISAPYAGSSPLEAALHFWRAFVRFTRPHTIIGTVLSIVSVSLMAISGPEDFTLRTLVGVLQAIVPALLMNVSIVGFNQVCDVEIDKVNKPYLPLANGDFTPAVGQALVVLTGAAALALGYAFNSPPLLWTLGLSLALGVVYSADMPLLRWKRSPVLAAACIFGVRALAVQFGFYHHMMSTVLQREPLLTFPLLFASGFMSIFSVVIAFFKDIPDVKGDRVSSIQTLSVRLGERPVLKICVALLLLAYAGAIVAGLYSPSLWCRCVLVGAHVLMAASLLKAQATTDTSSGASMTAMYMFIWKLFYAEYALLPLFGR